MITDQQTNFVYFSSILRDNPRYQPFWIRLEKILVKKQIPYGFISGTRDIWCRDYMPIQISKDRFVQFKFFPDYYLHPDHIHKLTIPHETLVPHLIEKKQSRLIVDGGNIIRSSDQVVLTEKIFKANPYSSVDGIRNTLKKDLGVEKVHIIPIEPLDSTGHSDGMVRYMSDTEIIYTHCPSQSESWVKKYKKDLIKTGLTFYEFPSVEINEKNEWGDHSARGCYINFAQIGNIILFPQFEIPEDAEALKEARRFYPECDVIPIKSNEVAKDGGVLNCITWNILV